MSEDLNDLHGVMEAIRSELSAIRETRQRSSWKWWVGVLAPLLFAAVIGAHAMVWKLNDRVTRIENSFFTVPDALLMEARIINKINELPATIQRLDDHEERLRALESRRE